MRCRSLGQWCTAQILRLVLDDDEAAGALCEVANLLAHAQLRSSAATALALGRLVAIRQPSGRTRGLVVGDALRRLVARILAQQLTYRLWSAANAWHTPSSREAGRRNCSCSVARPEAGGVQGRSASSATWCASVLSARPLPCGAAASKRWWGTLSVAVQLAVASTALLFFSRTFLRLRHERRSGAHSGMLQCGPSLLRPRRCAPARIFNMLSNMKRQGTIVLAWLSYMCFQRTKMHCALRNWTSEMCVCACFSYAE